MTGETQSPSTWWGDFNFDIGQSKQWQIGPLTLIVRRIDVMVGVAYKEDLKKVREVLDEVADKNPLCLEEPKPLYIFQGFGESSLDIQYSVWAKRENFLNLKNSIHEEIKNAFDAHGIEIPFPHRSIYTGSVTDPFPIKNVDSKQSD